ncbi:MAG: methyltransferase domain-containing protein [Chloroflexi bacterium]|nr:MAG: methyltransferase domain-containing protein [Chloroflexota bacterium]MBL1194330.1 methyltransferase domain-containing protein [Chloroflexota bacterium]NOH11620.1 methyltransferase domain-containing protein [Chloroflexota bacterium]
MNIFAITTRGLEEISNAEMQALPGIHDLSNGYRHIRATVQKGLSALLDLRTVDDVFLELTEWEQVGHERSTLAEFSERSTELALGEPLAQLRGLREIPGHPTFSVTANFVGKRNYSNDEIKLAVSEGVLQSQAGWQYAEDDRVADLNLRVFIEHSKALVGLRIGETPLHRRDYKQAQLPGSLKPTVAAAMLRIARLQEDQVCLDPFCGSGTIVIEAALAGAGSMGGDIEQAMLKAAETNRQAAGVKVAFSQWDAMQLPLPGAIVDLVVSNLPWGRQVEVDGSLWKLYEESYLEMLRVIKPGGKLVLLTSFPDLLPEEPEDQIEISLFGQTPSVLRFETA